MSFGQKEVVEQLKIQWKKLWQERVDDKLRAEGVAKADYCDLFVDKGTIIHATRDFKALNFREILEQHEITNADRFIPPAPHVGGWNKFIKTSITNQRSRKKRRAELYCAEKRRSSNLRKAAEAGCINNSQLA
jgi:hypothetical protein